MSGKFKTAFVFAGGGSLGAVQVGMLRALVAHGLKADLLERVKPGTDHGC
jgi:NTE family protein